VGFNYLMPGEKSDHILLRRESVCGTEVTRDNISMLPILTKFSNHKPHAVFSSV